jgi:prepilin-type N-terminal cleavage/methylation domain-containing protein
MDTSRRSEAGYTLVELAVTMAILLIFLSFATPVMFSALQQGMRTEDRIDLQNAGRVALRTMTTELRQAEALYLNLDPPSPPTGKNSVSFGVDLDGDNTIEAAEQLSYYVEEGVLYRDPNGGAAAPLAESVDTLEFTMYGSNPALDTDGDGVVEETELGGPSWQSGELANVTRVDIALELAQDDVDQAYSARVFLRNRAGD